MAKDDGDGSSIEAEIDGVEDGTGHRNSKMEFIHGSSVGRDDGDDLASLDSDGYEGRGELQTSTVSFRPGIGGGVIDNGATIAVDDGGSLKEADRRKGRGISRVRLQIFHGNELSSALFLPLQIWEAMAEDWIIYIYKFNNL